MVGEFTRGCPAVTGSPLFDRRDNGNTDKYSQIRATAKPASTQELLASDSTQRLPGGLAISVELVGEHFDGCK